LSDRKRLFDLAGELAKLEGDNWAGRVNFLGTVGLFVLIFVSGVFDLIQIITRWFISDYETGLPSALSHARTFGYLFIACVIVLMLGETARGSRER
jgi:hypothetical protein